MARNPDHARGPYRQTRSGRAQLLEMYERGDSWRDMAAALGLTTEGLRDRLAQAGVTLDRRAPRWEAAQHWPWPLTLMEVADRLYGETDAGARRRARTLIGNWLDRGWLVRVGWGRYGLPPIWIDDDSP